MRNGLAEDFELDVAMGGMKLLSPVSSVQSITFSKGSHSDRHSAEIICASTAVLPTSASVLVAAPRDESIQPCSTEQRASKCLNSYYREQKIWRTTRTSPLLPDLGHHISSLFGEPKPRLFFFPSEHRTKVKTS